MHVMILDNDTAILRSLELLLSERGHAVVTIEDPVEACAYFLADNPVPDVFILDYMMRDLTGADVLARIGPHLRDRCRVIVISGHTDTLRAAGLTQEHLQAILTKPLDLDRLCHLVEGTSNPHRV